MPKSTGKTGRGIKVEIQEPGSPSGAWLTIANVTSISPSGRDAEEIDFTHLLSEGGFREFRQGFKDPGQLGIEYQFTPLEDSHVELLERWVSGDVFPVRINFTGAGWPRALEGEAFVMNPGDITINVNDPIAGSSTLRFTGATEFKTI